MNESQASDDQGTARVSARLLVNPIHLLSLGFGVGLAPKAPGTFGTLVAVPIYLVLQPLSLGVYLSVVALAFVLGVLLCAATARAAGVHDHPAIVWDEVVGYLVCMTAAPAGWIYVVMGFALFRLFDIWKPWPIRIMDRGLGGGFGIMIDDLVAGLYGLAVLQLFVYLTADVAH